MGAGSITSNVKSYKKLVVVKTPEGMIETGMKKFGAMLGDEVEVGCGSVLNPGTVVGSHSNIYPLSSVRGYIPGGSIYKKQGEVVEKEKKQYKKSPIKSAQHRRGCKALDRLFFFLYSVSSEAGPHLPVQVRACRNLGDCLQSQNVPFGTSGD